MAKRFGGCLLLAFTAAVAPFAQAQAPAGQPGPEITLTADNVRAWESGGLRFLLLQGDAFVVQGESRVRARECVVVTPAGETEPGAPVALQILARGDVRVEKRSAPPESPPQYAARLVTNSGYVTRAAKELEPGAAENHALVKLALQTFNLKQSAPEEKPERLVEPVPEGGGRRAVAAPAEETQGVRRADVAAAGEGRGVVTPAQGFGTNMPQPRGGRRGGEPDRTPRIGTDPNTPRRLSLAPRTNRPLDFDKILDADGSEMILVNGGVQIQVEEPATGNLVSIATDRAVIWRTGGGASSIPAAPTSGLDIGQDHWQVYLEGNVQVNVGNIRSLARNRQVQLVGKQVFFDINRNKALVLDGFVETYDENFRIPFLMKADRLFMFQTDKYYGENTSFTTSPYRGQPGYAFVGRETYLEQKKQPIVNPFTGAPIADDNGEPLIRTRNFGTSYGTSLRIDEVPIFYTPYIRANLEHPLGPIETVRFGSTARLGANATVTLDVWRLFGIDYLPVSERMDWLWDIGYYGERGPAFGSRVNYVGTEPIGQPGSYYGRYLGWAIHDTGRDFLGVGRNDLVPPDENRGRALFQHYHVLNNDMTLLAGVSYLSDKNFLQSFFENEYDTGPDQETFLYLKQSRDQWAWTAQIAPRINDFLPQNDVLPRADGYILGRSFFEDRATYFSHSSIGYFRVRPPAEEPLLDSPTFDGEADTLRADTRHEIDVPFSLGDLTLVPYAIGRFTGYSEALDGDALGRGYAAGGMRASLPLWRVYPGVESLLFNLKGMAHKATLTADYMYAYANVRKEELPYIDQLDDDTSDLVRRQNLYRSYTQQGLPIPTRYDPRFEGLRRNLYEYPETIDRIHMLRFGLNQRLQTKRGPAGSERIIDWMTLDLHATWFPESDRDNLGEPFGLLDYNYKWHLGDRTSIISNGLYEPLDGTATASAALVVQRPPRSTLSIFYSHYATGPFESNFVGFNTSYRFSYKYAGFLATTLDFSQLERPSYNFGFTRIGLDFITNLSLVYTAGRNDLGVQFSVLPRIGARPTAGRGMGATLPFGVEPSQPIAPQQFERPALVPHSIQQNY